MPGGYIILLIILGIQLCVLLFGLVKIIIKDLEWRRELSKMIREHHKYEPAKLLRKKKLDKLNLLCKK